MKKLGKLKLNMLSEICLQDKEMNRLRGGGRDCSCSCYYAGSGGASSESNRSANYGIGDSGGYSTNGCNDYKQSDDFGTGYCMGCKDAITDNWY